MEERETIQHFSHPHSLQLQLALDEDQQKQSCSGCLEPLFVPCFSCGECQLFHLHRKCAQVPSQITNSPFHSKHPTLTLELMSISCDFCEESREMFYYWCSSCTASLDIKCAFFLHNMDENFRELKHVDHQHPLTFIQNPNDELKRVDCYWCQKPLADSVFVCLDCRFYLHKKCAQLPTQIYHPTHRKHPLYIEDAQLFCQLCQKTSWSLFYRCLPCEFDIDIECVRVEARYTTIEDKSHHEHQFTKFLRFDSFMCDACGTEGNHISCICSLCHVMIHKKCISLPRFIKVTRHHHNMSHNYFFQKTKLEEHDCGICLSEVKAEYGSYNCLKQDCSFVVHVNCAMERYVEIDEANVQADEESIENSAANSSITCVLERNEHGEAIKVKHFSHEHDLILGNSLKEDDDDKHCDGCMLSISTSFYYCSQCEFLLHKTCAELPRKKNLWLHPSLASLISSTYIFPCDRCYRCCGGFFYKTDEGYHFCLRCARIPHIRNCEGHKHPLFFDFNFKGKCNGCGANWFNGAYRCKECTNIALDFACITLPESTRHKCDKHFLKLAFHEENDDPQQHYCDICEEKRDPNLWFYHCAICDNSAHLKCALGKYPFIKMKIGTTFRPNWFHPHHHPLIVVKTISDTCSICDRSCWGVALKCTDSTCNYIIHLDHCYDLVAWWGGARVGS